MEIIKKISKFGNTWHVILPKDLVEFYRWENAEVGIEIDSEKIVIKKLSIPEIKLFGGKK